DIRRELEWAGKSTLSATPSSPKVSAKFVWLVAGFFIAVFLVSVLVIGRRTAPFVPEHAFQFTLTLDGEPAQIPVLSPDGQFLTFVLDDPEKGTPSVWVRAFDSVAAKRLPGTEGVGATLIWSPDSRWIGFYSGGKLKKISPLGGPAQTIAELAGFQDADWS